MHKRNMIITANHIPQRTQPLLYTLDLDRIWKRIPQMLEFLVGRCGGHQQAVLVADSQTADDAGAGDGSVADGDDVLEFRLEDGVEVLRGADGDDGVGVCEAGEDADPGHKDGGLVLL